MPQKHRRMPTCNAQDQELILDAIDAMRGASKTSALALLDDVGPKQLCKILHSMRRWYSANTGIAAWNIIPYRRELMQAMDLRPQTALGAYRGFKVFNKDKLSSVEVGDVLTIPVTRNAGCSSWSTHEKIAHRFSGATKEKTGLVVQLVDTKGVEPFIVPPADSEEWFNRLYRATMGKSFRHKEGEIAIYGKRITVEIVRVKRK